MNVTTTVSGPSSNLPSSSSHAAPQPLYWSVRRELWENWSIYIVPLIVAAVELFGFALSSVHLPARRRAVLLLDEAHQRALISLPYNIAAIMLVMTAFVVGLFYCLDAMHGERRDRSILFWKSLPVSDSTTVLSKALIALAVLPVITFAIIVATQFLMFLLTSAVLTANGLSAAITWKYFPLLRESLIFLYALVVIALWHAPIYGWALLISGLARRATFLWAVLPPFAIAIFEKVTFNTSHFYELLKHRLFGFGEEAFAFFPKGNMPHVMEPTPGKYFSTPGLWIGLIFAVVFVIAAIRLRRYRGPL